MANLKACVQTKRKDGMYIVYIRVTHLRKVAYIRTSMMVNERGLRKRDKEITDPFIVMQSSKLIKTYQTILNTVDISTWDVHEVIEFIHKGTDEISFTTYADEFITNIEKDKRMRTAKNYRLALKSLCLFAASTEINFSRLTSGFLNQWIDSLKDSARKKEMYPVCIREIWKSAQRLYNDEENGLIRILSPWSKIDIPKSDTTAKRAIPADLLRKFFQVIPDDSRFKHPLQELGQDVAKLSLCMCGVNTVDLFEARKEQYKDGKFCYNRAKTRTARADNAYFEIRIPNMLIPTFEKYLSEDPNSPWLFDFHDRLSNSDSFNANVNIGIRQICDKVEGLKANFGSFRHTWATIAQNNCGASLAEVDFGLNHSTHRLARIYTKLDYSPAWKLNEKVVEFVFFTNDEIETKEEDDSFEKISKYNLMKGEAFQSGNIIALCEDTGFTNIQQIIDKLVAQLPNTFPDRTKVQIKITNIDKKQSQFYEHCVNHSRRRNMIH